MAPRPVPFSVLVQEQYEAAAEDVGLRIPSPSSVLAGPLDQAVILVDPLSTGVLLQKRVFEAGIYRVVIVWSDRSQIGAREKHFQRSGHPREDFAAVITHEDGKLEETLSAILSATANMTIAAVMCGSEFGVLLEDQIADGLNAKLGTTHLKSSGMPSLESKVDKHLQANAIREAGLAAVKEKLAYTEDDVRAFLEENKGSEISVVVKPQRGSGSVGVMFCDSEQSVLDAFHTILAGEHKAHCGDKYRHYSFAGVLIQEYLKGSEYIVNSVLSNGVMKTTAMFKYDKRPYNGAPFVCFSKELVLVSDENCEEILDYTEKVAEVLGFQNGAIHAEIMYTSRGPVLVEMNCRLHGGNAAWVRPASMCMGYDQLSVFMDAYLFGGKMFPSIPSRPVTAYSYCHQVKMRGRVEGTLDCVIESQLDRIKGLSSYVEHFFNVRPGDKMTKTIDMPSIPGEVTLVHQDKGVLESDYNELNAIMEEGLFQVR